MSNLTKRVMLIILCILFVAYCSVKKTQAKLQKIDLKINFKGERK